MRIVANELFKVFCKKQIIFIFLGLIILNGVLLYMNENNSIQYNYYTPKAYKDLYKDLKGLSNEMALEKLNRQYNDLVNIPIISSKDDELGILEKEYLVYTNMLWSEQSLYRDLILEVQKCNDYADYLRNIKESANTMMGISILSKPNSFSYKNIIKTAIDFERLEGNELTVSPSRGVKMATEFLATDIIAIFMMVIVVGSLITKEKELSQISLIKTTYHGRSRLILTKLFITFIGCIIIILVLYGTNFTMAYFTYGYGDMGRMIQSVSGYLGSNLSITVTQYFILFLLAKTIVYLLVSFIIFLVAVIARETVYLYIYLLTIFCISSIMYYSISATSYLSVFKFINILSFLNTYTLFHSYLNINLVGYPINYIPIFLMTIIIGIVSIIILSTFLFCHQKVGETKDGIFLKLQKKIAGSNLPKVYKTTSIIRHEAYKIFIGGKVLLILIIFAGIRIYSYQPMTESFGSMEGYYYKQYMLKLDGEVNKEKIEFIENEKERLENAYDEELDLRMAFMQVRQHRDYLESRDSSHFVYDSGYKLLTGGNIMAEKKDLQLGLTAVAVLISCLIYVYCVEYENGAMVLLKTSYKGRKNTFISKLFISVFIMTVIYIITYVPYFYNILSVYGTRGLSAPAYSMEHLFKIPANVTILCYLILISILRYIGLLLAVMIIFWISVLFKSYISALLASLGILVLPILISMLGIRAFDYFLLNPFLIGNIIK